MDQVVVRLLGTVGIERDGVLLPTTSRVRQTLLALLAVAHGQAVPVDVLIDEVWGSGDLPAHPRPTLQTGMTRVRQWLGVTDEAGGSRIRAVGDGYCLDIDPGQVDISCFDRAAALVIKNAPTASPSTTVMRAEDALRWWRGVPFPGLQAPRLVAERARVEERWIQVQENLAAALIVDARPERAIDVVVPLIRDRPSREQLYVLALQALHRAGQAREATELYLEARRHLREEHGVEPGPELRATHRTIVAERVARVPRCGLRPTMMGRDAALEKIVTSLSDDGRVVVVDGEAGIGKSTLMIAAVHAAQEAGAHVSRGAWDDDETPMSAWHEALAGHPGEGTPPGLWVHDRLVSLAGEGPALMALDDVHRADTASLGVLRTLMRMGVPPGIVVVMAARHPDVEPHPRWHAVRDELSRSDHFRSITLGELDRDTVLEIARSRLHDLGAAGADRVAETVWRRAGGHPLHVSALLGLVENQADARLAAEAADGVPDALRAALERQLAGVPTATRQRVDALAVLRPIDLAGLAGALRRRPLDLAVELRPAVDAGILTAHSDRMVFRHELIADAACESVPAVTRHRLHHGRLTTLVGSHDEPFTRLRHTVGAGPLVTTAELSSAYREAGKAAYRRRAVSEAVELLDRVDAASAGEPDVAVYRGLALASLGRLTEADDTLDAALDVALRAGAWELAAMAAIGDEPSGLRLTGDTRRRDRLSRVADQALPDRVRFDVLAALARENTLHGLATGDDAVTELERLAAGLGDPHTDARLAAIKARAVVERPIPAGERLKAATEAHRLAIAVDDPALVGTTTSMLMESSLATGRPLEARAHRDELERIARRWHRPQHLWAVLLFDTVLLLAQGRYDEADGAALLSRARGRELGLPDADGAYAVYRLTRQWMEGHLSSSASVAAGAAVDHPSVPAWSAAAAVAEAQAGRLDRATEHLAEYRRRRGRLRVTVFDRPGMALATAAAFTLADTGTARLVRDDLVPLQDSAIGIGFGAAAIGPAALFTGIAAIVLDDQRTAREDLGRAAGLAAGAGWTPWVDAAEELIAWIDADRPRGAPLPLGLVPPS